MDQREIASFRHYLRKIERYLFKNLKVDEECCGSVSFNECHILMELSRSSDIAMADLISGLGLDKSVVTRTVDKMVRSGLIVRKENPEDRRMKALSLTDRGKATAVSINSHMNGKFTRLFASLEGDNGLETLRSAQIMASVFAKWDTLED